MTIVPVPNFITASLIVAALFLSSCGDSNNTNQSNNPPPTPPPDRETLPDPVFKPGDNQAVIYYYRADGNYQNWVLHLWNNEQCTAYTPEQFTGSNGPGGPDGTTWPDGPAPTAIDPNYGAYWTLSLREDYGDCANYIIHIGDVKGVDSNDQLLDLSESGNPDRWAFAIEGEGIFETPQTANQLPVTINGASAHWIDRQTIVWDIEQATDVRLHFSADASLTNIDALETNPTTQQIKLTAVNSGLTAAQRALVPHLAAGWSVFRLTESVARLRELVGNQLIVTSHGSNGIVTHATRVQAAKVLDDLYTSAANDADEQPLGVRYSSGNVALALWAPTAKSVKLKLYNQPDTPAISTTTMTRDDNTGIWSHSASESSLDRKYYRYELEVFHPATGRVETYEATDPYSLSLSANGRYSQLVNLSDSDLKPNGWDGHTSPSLANPEDHVIYESHIRDFSISDSTVPSARRGKYLAFTESASGGVLHLKNLQQSGMNTFHVLPSFDYATVNENFAMQINLDSTVMQLCARVSNAPVCSDGTSRTMTLQQVLASYNPATTADEEKAQALVESMRDLDGFNWGYDPQHYTVPEGSYASDADGVARIVEMRSMVMALHGLGFRVAFDVVYNHTSSSGINTNSVLDRVVPGYYHRYHEVTGAIQRSTCCENTATEHRMFHKLMTDSLLVWSRDYRIDAFRFDIMGHSPKASIQEALTAVQAVDADTYFYGEGWNFGEVAGDRLFVQATQNNLAGTEIGTFNDRYRDPIRDAAMWMSTPNAGDTDLIRLGLAGTLRTYKLEASDGVTREGQVYRRPSYADDPADIINYVSKHDNETLWDRLQLFLPTDISHANRVRIFHIASALPLMSQGVPFLQLGGDLMRSKSLDRNSFNSGDWFNRVDFTLMSNNWRVGLPPATDNLSNDSGGWPARRRTFANNNINPTAADITRVASVFREFLEIRTTSPLFRLTTGAQIKSRVGFHNTGPEQTPAVIVMSIDDGIGQPDLDPQFDAIVLFINASAAQAQQTISSASGFLLHNKQSTSNDPTVRTAAFSADQSGGGTFTVPAYTMAVFVKHQGANQGVGLAPDASAVAARYTEELQVVDTSDTKTDLTYLNSGRYTALLEVGVGSFSFRFQSKNSTHDLGFSDITQASGSLALRAGSNGSISFTASDNGVYRVTLDAVPTTPQVSVVLARTISTCSAITLADSGDDYPFVIDDDDQDGFLYVRGNHSDWSPAAPYKMLYKGQNRYQAVANFNPGANLMAGADGVLPVQFKLASSDDDWTTQLYAQASNGGLESSPLSLDTTHTVEFGDGGTSNNTVELTSGGRYSFLLTLTPDANPELGSNVGTLVIQQCR